MFEPLELPLMRRALLGGLLVALLTSYYSPFIVQRRLAFLGSGLAHAAFGGVALGLLLGVQPLWIAVPYTVAVGFGIIWLSRRSQLAPDTTIGVFFAVSMALGIIFLFLREGYTNDAYTYLFGSVLAVTWTDIAWTTLLLLATLAALPLWPRWAYATFDRELARADRVPVAADDYLMAAAIALVVVLSMKVVGIVLIAAFLVLPGATGRLLAPTFGRMALWSVAVAVVTVIGGLYISYYLDLPSGPSIILLEAGLFVVALGLRGRG